MSTGPVQLVVLGFNHPGLNGDVIAELERLRQNDMVRVIDAVVVHKDAAGALEVAHLRDEAIELGRLVGLRGHDAEADFDGALAEHDTWDVVDDIPTDSAAALVLLEHRWAVPLGNAVARVGYPISDGFVRTHEKGNEMFATRRVARHAALRWS